MYCKVFIGQAELLFAEMAPSGYQKAPLFSDENEFEKWLNQFYNAESEACFVIANNTEKYWQWFKQAHILIEASGGLVTNNTGALLVIERLGVWDLPKGKIDAGETPKEAAVREVEEECGLKDLQITKGLPDTYHCYELKGKRILKRTYWFAMHHIGNKYPKPQHEEDITTAKFMNMEEVKNAMQRTYPSLLPLFETYCSRYK